MRIARLPALAALLVLANLAPATATHDLRHGDICSGPGEPSFLCGDVIVLIHVGSDINLVLNACQPLGEVIDAVENRYSIAVEIGEELALRDCYGAQPTVGQAELTYFGQTEPNTAMRAPGSGLWTAAGVVLLMLSGCCLALRHRGARRRAAG